MKRVVNSKSRGLGISLEKLAKSTKKNIWLVLADKITKPCRRKAEVNVYELGALANAKENAGKIFVVPGKVLGDGEAMAKIDVACLKCSPKARKKIEKAGGRVIYFEGLIDEKPSANKLVIVR